MSNGNAGPTQSSGPRMPPGIIALVVLGMFAAITWWQNNQVPRAVPGPDTQTSRPDTDCESATGLPDQHAPTLPRLADEDRHEHTVAQDNSEVASSQASSERHGSPSHQERRNKTAEPSSHTTAEKNDNLSYQVPNQSIRNLNGKVVFQGTIDLKPTLDRIERGDANRHKNDGTTFQNREGRLPKKASGYYKEYVHPTPGESGPGPQRIILGKEGEIWYTPDHYKSFVQIPMRERSE